MGKAKEVNRIVQLDPEHATGATKRLFDDVMAKFGFVPNVFRVLGNAPVALEGFLNFSTILANGAFDARVREQIALTVAESNLCCYCLSAHTFIGGKIGLTQKDLADAIRSNAAAGKTDAILKLVRSIIVQRGQVKDSDLQRARRQPDGRRDRRDRCQHRAQHILELHQPRGPHRSRFPTGHAGMA
jgi:AhpD family alkylhydroperoxidase